MFGKRKKPAGNWRASMLSRYFSGQSVEEVAAIVGVSPECVRAHYRAIERNLNGGFEAGVETGAPLLKGSAIASVRPDVWPANVVCVVNGEVRAA